MTEITLQSARHTWLLAAIKKLKLTNPVTEIANKTEYSKGAISNYISGTRAITGAFVKLFAEKFEIEHDYPRYTNPKLNDVPIDENSIFHYSLTDAKLTKLERIKKAIDILKAGNEINSLADLAGEMGYSRQGTISEILSGRTSLSDKFIKAFCSRFNFVEKYINEGVPPMRGMIVDERLAAILKGKTPEEQQALLNNLINKLEEEKELRRAKLQKQIDDLDKPIKLMTERTNAFDLGAHDDTDIKEMHQGKKFIDLGNGFYHMYVPLVHEYAYGGYLKGFSDSVWLDELPLVGFTVDNKPQGLYRAFKIRGDSMDDNTKESIADGDTVLGRVISPEYWKSKLHLHKFKDYIIVHKSGILVKRISKHDVANGILHIHSLNQDKEQYPDATVDLRDVMQLLNVIMVSRGR